jgi:hypothetical protein
MKYVAFIFWMALTAVMCLLVLPAVIFGENWFRIGWKILES